VTRREPADDDPGAVAIDTAMDAAATLRRLRWRCRRGMRELDALLMSYADICYAHASPAEQAAFAGLLMQPDPDILGLLIGREAVDDPSLHAVVEAIRGRSIK
jgi:antitoxin CptB